jgi:hypothetical protein
MYMAQVLEHGLCNCLLLSWTTTDFGRLAQAGSQSSSSAAYIPVPSRLRHGSKEWDRLPPRATMKVCHFAYRLFRTQGADRSYPPRLIWVAAQPGGV